MRESIAFEGGALLLESKNSVGEMGHRIAKHVYASDNGYMLEKSTYYILDAQGNVMSTYERVINSEEESVSFAQTEKHIFGSSRLGMNSESIPMLGSQNNSYSMELVNHRIGERSYELSNHLGNVLSVISDKIISHDDNDDDEIDWLVADIRQSTDYSPFGVVLNERNFTPPPTLVTVPDIITVYETDFESPTVTTSGATTTIDGWSHWSSLTTIFLDNSATQRLKVVSVHGAAGAHQYLAVTPGVTHTLTVKVDKGTAPLVNILVFYNCPNITSNSGSPYALVAASSNGVYTLTFTSTTGYIFVQMRQMGTFYLDDITITKAGTSTIALSNDYRYAFNGMEKDDELKGEGNSYDFGARMLDPRLGRWLTIDPLYMKYSAHSPYHFALNSPIMFNDPNGEDAVVTIGEPDGNNIRTITITSTVYITGKGLSSADIKELKDQWEYNYGNNRLFEGVDKDGVKYHLEVKVNFVDATSANNPGVSAPVKDFINNGMNKSVSSKVKGDKDINGKPSGIEYGENVVQTGWGGRNVTRTNSSQAWINDKEDPIYTIMHEVWHLLGLSDRYDAKFGKPRVPHPGYEYDPVKVIGYIMGGTGYELGQANIDAMIQSCLNILNDPNNKMGNLFTIYKSIINDKALDDLDPNKKKAIIEKEKGDDPPE